MIITLISMSCCNPALRPQDQQYKKRVEEALATAKVTGQIELASATDMMHSMSDVQAKKIMPLFKKHGAAVAPIMLIDGDIVFYGGVPTLEKLVETISARAGGQGGGDR
jgi:hypothetical protein